MRALTQGAMTVSLYDILDDRKQPQMSAEEAESAVMAEFERLGGADIG